MKRLLCLLFLLLSYHCGVSQRIHFLDTSNKWMTHYSYWGGISNYYFTSVGNDTVWNGVSYKKMDGSGGTNGWKFLVREDTAQKKVYFRTIATNTSTLDTSEYLGYDFNLKVGDTLPKITTSFQVGYVVVTSIDSTQIQGNYYKVWHFNSIGSVSFNHSLSTIESIGDIYGPTYGFIVDGHTGGLFLKCFTTANTNPPLQPAVGSFDNVGSCIVGVNDIQINRCRVHPNPAHDGIYTLDYLSSNLPDVIVLYNMYGQKIKQLPFRKTLDISEFPKGMYHFQLTFIGSKPPVSGTLLYQ